VIQTGKALLICALAGAAGAAGLSRDAPNEMPVPNAVDCAFAPAPANSFRET
jgi:hypothetical protein